MAKARFIRISNEKIERIYAESSVRQKGFVMAAPHCHPYCELFFIESGACSFFVGNNVYDLHAGDFLLIPPQVFHYTRYPFGACKRHNVFFRTGDVYDSVLPLLPEKENFFGRVRVFQVPEAYRGQIVAHIERMARENKIDDERSEMMLELLLQEFLLLCARECTFLHDLPEAIHTTDAPIVKAAQFIDFNYMEEITTADIAAAAGYSPNYLSRKFREAAGIGVHEYLVFIRLQHAALELLSTSDSVTDIALRCGFSDGNYFKDAFKKKYGVTPSRYRK